MAFLPADISVTSRVPQLDTSLITGAANAPLQGGLAGLQFASNLGLTREQLGTMAARIAANNAKNQNVIDTMPGLSAATNAQNQGLVDTISGISAATNAKNLAATQLAPSDAGLKIAENDAALKNVGAKGALEGINIKNQTSAGSRVANAAPTLDDIYANEQIVAKKNAETQVAIVNDQNDAQKSKATLDSLLASQALQNNSPQSAIIQAQLAAQLADAKDAPARAIAIQNAKLELTRNQAINQKAQADYNEWYRGLAKTNQDPRTAAIAEITKLDQDDKLTDYAQVTNPKTGKDTYEDANGGTKPYRLTDYVADTRTSKGGPVMQSNTKWFNPATWNLPDTAAARDDTAEKLLDHKKLNDLLRQSYMGALQGQSPQTGVTQALRPGNLPLPQGIQQGGMPQLSGPASLLQGQSLNPQAATQQSAISTPAQAPTPVANNASTISVGGKVYQVLRNTKTGAMGYRNDQGQIVTLP